MAKFDKMLICTDLDGTLFKNDKTVSVENIEAIEYFKSQGGYFTFVTGRMPFFVSEVIDAIMPNAPFGCINGGGLYDYLKDEYVKREVMPESVLELVEYVDKSLPAVGIQVNTFYKTYFSKENETMEIFRRITNLPNLVCDYNNIKEPMAKIVFGTESEDEILSLEKMLREHPNADNFDFIRSEKTLFEILPKGVGKGSAISNLCSYLNIDKDKTIAIGDYNNDISMFKAAKIGVAVSNACKEAIDAADYVTVSNEENAIAKLIEDIENGKILI